MFRSILNVHIALGSIGLLLGPLVLFGRKTSPAHRNLGEIYHAVMLGICGTAVCLALLNWTQLWGFLYIGTGSYAFAFAGYIAGKVRCRNWLVTHVIGQCGSYIAIVTAVLVVNWRRLPGSGGSHSVWSWLLPTLVGTPIIIWLVREVVLTGRPKGKGFGRGAKSL
jgi:uncharacterized membrane protein YeaQ/YmgE (transglycosylase-associated protein family)